MKREVREQARKLRQQGASVREIAKLLHVSKGTASLWVRDIQLSADQIAALKQNQRRYAAQNRGAQQNRQKFQALRKHYQDQGRIKAREMRPLHLAGCMLFWAEGAKRRNNICFVNSDTNMLLLFIRFLREEMFVDDSMITL